MILGRQKQREEQRGRTTKGEGIKRRAGREAITHVKNGNGNDGRADLHKRGIIEIKEQVTGN